MCKYDPELEITEHSQNGETWLTENELTFWKTQNVECVMHVIRLRSVLGRRYPLH